MNEHSTRITCEAYDCKYNKKNLCIKKEIEILVDDFNNDDTFCDTRNQIKSYTPKKKPKKGIKIGSIVKIKPPHPGITWTTSALEFVGKIGEVINIENSWLTIFMFTELKHVWFRASDCTEIVQSKKIEKLREFAYKQKEVE